MLNRIKKNIGLIIVVFLSTILFVNAGSTFNVTIKELDTNDFPRVQLTVEINGDTDGLSPTNFQIHENGELNKGPIVMLPPKSLNNKIDLFILLDKSGNTKEYQSIIKANIKALVKYMKSNEVDLEVHITEITVNDKHPDAADAPESLSFTNEAQIIDGVNSISFDSIRPTRTYGLNKIYNFTSNKARSGADKIALIINGSQFNDEKKGDDTTYNVHEVVTKLAENNFTTFVVGYPIKQVFSQNSENESIARASSGGYLGSFGSDLTVIYDLLKKRDSNSFVFQYYSNQLPSSAGSAELYILDYLSKGFSYPIIEETEPQFIHATANEALVGKPLPIRIEVNPFGKLVNVLDMYYFDENSKLQNIALGHERKESTDETLIYTGEIPANGFPSEEGEYVRYYVTVNTPYDVIGSDEDYISIPIFAYDDGITLIPTIVNDEKVIWRWEGETVDMGDEYELWAGDTLIKNTKEKSWTIPVTECSRYQVVKLKVHVKAGEDHPKAGGWSNFSRPGEVFVGEDTEITEKEGIGLMIECLDEKQTSSFSSFVSGESNYSSNRKLYLEKTLYYFTGVVNPSLKDQIRFERFRLLYYLMNFIGHSEYTDYPLSSNYIPRSILYKVITNTNQKGNLGNAFSKAVEELARRMRGNSSF